MGDRHLIKRESHLEFLRFLPLRTEGSDKEEWIKCYANVKKCTLGKCFGFIFLQELSTGGAL